MRTTPSPLILCLALFSIFGCGSKKTTHTDPLELGMWYWHSPFEISAEDDKTLDDIGITTLYVRAGTFTFRNGRAQLILPQTWKSMSGNRKLVAVFNFETSLASSLYELDIDSLSDDVANAINDQTSKAPFSFSGIQFDVDSPTSKLKSYAKMLSKLRGKINSTWTLSATGLPAWLSSKDVDEVANAVDFLVPQFYENHFGKTIDDVRPVANLETFEWGLEKIERLKHKMHVGIPSYGHAMLFDEKGKLVSMYRGLPPAKALEHPSLEHVASRPMNSNGRQANKSDYVGEDLMLMKANRPDARGKGLGYQIAYTVPQTQVLSKHLALLSNRPENIVGAIIYRFPEPGESLTLPLESVEAAVKKLDHQFQCVIAAVVQADLDAYWIEYAIAVSSFTWNYPSPDSFAMTLDLGGAQLQEVVANDGLVAWGTGDFIRTSRARADTVRYRIGHLLPGSKHRLRLRVLAPTGAKITGGSKAITAGSSSVVNFQVKTVTLAPRK